MYAERLRLEHLRSFRQAELDFLHPGRPSHGPGAHRNVNLLLGDNGSGKTTILRALAIGALSPVLSSSGWAPYRLVRQVDGEEQKEAEIEVDLALDDVDIGGKPHIGTETFSCVIRRRGDYEEPVSSGSWTEEIYQDRSPAFFVVGYGATRRVENERHEAATQIGRSKRARYRRVASLFEDQVALVPLNAWLPSLVGTPRFDEVRGLLDDLLGGHATFTGSVAQDEFVLRHRNADIPFPALSDGYRAFLGWVGDLLFHLNDVAPTTPLRDLPGLVLLDEIDLHLHPQWQRTVIPTLADALPRLQFVFTTHSPIVAGTLQSENTQVVELDESGASTVLRLRERIHGLNADQILTSSYFNLNSTRAPAAQDELIELSKRARDGDDDAKLAFLRRLAGDDAATAYDGLRTSRPDLGSPATVKSAAAKATKAVKKGAAPSNEKVSTTRATQPVVPPRKKTKVPTTGARSPALRKKTKVVTTRTAKKSNATKR